MVNAVVTWIFIAVIILIFTNLTVLDLVVFLCLFVIVAFVVAAFLALVRVLYDWMVGK